METFKNYPQLNPLILFPQRITILLLKIRDQFLFYCKLKQSASIFHFPLQDKIYSKVNNQQAKRSNDTLYFITTGFIHRLVLPNHFTGRKKVKAKWLGLNLSGIKVKKKLFFLGSSSN